MTLTINGYVEERTLADGRFGGVMLMTFGRGRIIAGTPPPWGSIEQAFCYDSIGAALIAFRQWDGHGEPDGWVKDALRQRYRPGGDPEKEYVRHANDEAHARMTGALD